MDKKKKILLIVGIVLVSAIAIALVGACIFLKFNSDAYSDVYLDEVKISKSIENEVVSSIDDEVSVVDELNKKVNLSAALDAEKFIFDNKVGMYDFKITSDFIDSKLTFVIKNHTKENVEAFKYRLQLIDSTGTILGTMDFDSKELPALAKYKVTVDIDSDIADVYDIIPVTDFETYGYIGGVDIENK